jgi:outer membrane protein OmpA-like peptidoglycan-associated protein
MTHSRILSLTLVSAALLAACATAPVPNAMLEQARTDYRSAAANPQARDLAGGELKQAADALARADEAWARKDAKPDVDHLAYLAKQRAAIAEETARQKGAELAVAEGNATRDRTRLAARTAEADTAHRSADAARQQSQEAQRQATLSQQQADAARAQATASQQRASEAQQRNAQLEAQMRDLNATKTDRGMVVTIGDVLFDTDQARLKSGGMRNVEKLAGFFEKNPQRKALVEGFTDSTGSPGHNQELSGRRADAVRTALVGLGVAGDRISTRGYGEAYPVAGNDNASGRQLNRRVEIVLSDDSGVVAPR